MSPVLKIENFIILFIMLFLVGCTPGYTINFKGQTEEEKINKIREYLLEAAFVEIRRGENLDPAVKDPQKIQLTDTYINEGMQFDESKEKHHSFIYVQIVYNRSGEKLIKAKKINIYIYNHFIGRQQKVKKYLTDIADEIQKILEKEIRDGKVIRMERESSIPL